MDHHYIEEHNIADLYLMGKLSAEERAHFEEHFVDCQECLDRLETTEDFRAALRSVAAEEAAQPRAYVQAGLLAWGARFSRARQAALLAGAILLVALPLALLIRETRSARRELAQAKQASAEWQRKYEERGQASRDMAKEMQAREQQSAAQRDQLAAQLERERQERARLAEEVNKATRPQASLPVFALSVVRSRGGEPANQIMLPRSSQWIVLSLEFEPDPDLQSYRATLSTADDQRIWSASNLRPNARDALALNFNTSLFKPGNYLLTLEGLTAQGRYVSVARYPFRVITK